MAYLQNNGLRMTIGRIRAEFSGAPVRSRPGPVGAPVTVDASTASDARSVKRPTAPGVARVPLRSRRDKVALLRSFIPQQAALGLEISPNIHPMMTSGDGVTVQYLDLCTTEELLERARQQGVDTAQVPRVDYVHDPQRRISECVGGRKFDFVLSSHVIEHIPNIIGHFQDVSRILNDGGVYCLLAPDMSLCFDVNKPPTTFGTLVEAYVNDWKHAPLAAMLDEYRSAVWLGNKNAWSLEDSGIFVPKYKNWRGQISRVLANPAALDVWRGHIWRFTPESFAALFAEVRSFELIDLDVERVVGTHHMDFLCVMRKPGADR